jgi:predicted nucleic acid-binding protein
MIILDTDILTLFAYGTNDNLRQQIESVDENEKLAVTIITWMEILQGRFASILKSANEEQLIQAMKRFQDSQSLLNSFVLLDVDDNAAQHFERLRKQKKMKMKRPDMLIACIALAHNALLVTRNVNDYKAVTGLDVANWAD